MLIYYILRDWPPARFARQPHVIFYKKAGNVNSIFPNNRTYNNSSLYKQGASPLVLASLNNPRLATLAEISGRNVCSYSRTLCHF